MVISDAYPSSGIICFGKFTGGGPYYSPRKCSDCNSSFSGAVIEKISNFLFLVGVS